MSKIERARAEGYEAAATGRSYDPFYLSHHVSAAERVAYRIGFNTGLDRGEDA